MTLQIGDRTTAGFDAVIDVDDAASAPSSLPTLSLESGFSAETTSAALVDFRERIVASQSRRQAERRMGLIKEAETVLEPVQMRAFQHAVETWPWTGPEQEFLLMRGIGEVKRMRSASAGGPLRDSLSSRFAWRSLWEAACDRLAG
jgi:hypothetical protein